MRLTPDRQRRWLGFFVALSLLSLSANGYFVFRLHGRRMRNWAAQWRKVPPVRPDDHTRGPSNAAATVIVYSDFDCPYCRQLHQNLGTLQQTDAFRWVYRHAPRRPRAERAAEVSECAARQERFWQLADSLSATPLRDGTPEELAHRAETVGIDAARLTNCLEAGEGAARVRAQQEEARELWISGTPTFYVNGHRHVGLLDVEGIRRLLQTTGR